jgi:Domain of unknown function (DUF4336)
MLKEFGPDIWIASGPDVSVAGFHYPSRMVIIKLASGDLFILSPIQLSQDIRGKLHSIGQVQHVVAPNSLHHLFLSEWRRAYPEAKFYAPPGLRKKREDIAFDADLTSAPSTDWGGEIDQVLMRGNLITIEAVFFHYKSGTVLFTDLIQQLPASLISGWRAIIAKLDLMMEGEPSVPRKFRLAFTSRRVARESLQYILAWPAKKVLMAHGTPIENDAQAYLRRTFKWLIP